MTISNTLAEYLHNEGINFELVKHPHTRSSLETAETAHIPGDKLAKCVVLEDEKGYLMAVIPSTHKVDLDSLARSTGRRMNLVSEVMLNQMFHDCELGAIPPIGTAYGYDSILDECLIDCEDVYFEAGDHEDLIHISGTQFKKLMQESDKAQFSYHI